MHAKENIAGSSSSSSTVRVKPEPGTEPQVNLFAHTHTPSRKAPRARPHQDVLGGVKKEGSVDEALALDSLVKFEDAPAQDQGSAMDYDEPLKPADQPQQPAAPTAYTSFRSSAEINYTPEEALRQGLGMVSAMDTGIKTLDLGNKMRRDAWMRDIERLRTQGAPTTMIAVCGATGAGKSSTLNAILDDNIVPTSGMRACTAVVTEISYHDKRTIEGDVSFLSVKEWRDEIDVLINDLVDEDGAIKRANDLRSDAGIAWSKLHAVYPTITQDMIGRMTVDQILAYDPRISRMLGTVKHVVANNSKVFGEEVAKYIDSKEKKRGGDKKDNDKAKSKEKEKASEPRNAGSSLMDLVRKKATATSKVVQKGTQQTKNKNGQFDPDGPAYWPLIRQVRVRCNSKALSTGAILVDLPGVADANAARNSIAKDYMKKCDCIWILAPITRAVDDKTARDLLGDAFKMQLMMDGNYDPSTITFVATKCDDISCSEVIPALNLERDSELVDLEERLETATDEIREARAKKEEADGMCKDIDAGLKQIRAILKEHEEHLEAVEAGEPYKPNGAFSSTAAGKKRKRGHGSDGGTPKRRKADDSDDDAQDDSEFEMDSDAEMHSERGTEPAGTSNGASDEDDEQEEEPEPLSEEELKAKIVECKDAVKAGREQLNEVRRERKEASDAITKAKRDEAKAQKDKNSFCSLKRSFYSRSVLKEDFRTGLKDLDDAAAEEWNPDSFDPSINLRDYSIIDLPVYTVSSRDYVRITGQAKGDGDPTCFTDPADTGIPDLQKWCQTLTVSARERSARNFFAQLQVFANQVKTYVTGIGDVTANDRLTLRELWESNLGDDDDDPEEEAYVALCAQYAIYGIEPPPRAKRERVPPKVDARGNPIGITPRLINEFVAVVDECIKDLNDVFKAGLEEKCKVGAKEASTAAPITHDEFAASMHWGTYRATLRRMGEWRRDLNAELTAPMTRQIASSWAKVFETDMFAGFQASTEDIINKLVRDVEASAPAGLRDKVKLQAEAALAAARLALKNSVGDVKAAMDLEQKEISRCLAPHIQNQLRETYLSALDERGKGSVARQKALMRRSIDGRKAELFDAGSELLLGRLSTAAETVGKALDSALGNLAPTVENNMSVLWEEFHDNPVQVRARACMVDLVSKIQGLVELWTRADKERIPV